jgi:hypothetical protein
MVGEPLLPSVEAGESLLARVALHSMLNLTLARAPFSFQSFPLCCEPDGVKSSHAPFIPPMSLWSLESVRLYTLCIQYVLR